MLRRLALCALTFHAPDHSALVVMSEAIKAIRPIGAHYHDHVAHGVRSVIYTGVSQTGFGVVERLGEVLRMMECSP